MRLPSIRMMSPATDDPIRLILIDDHQLFRESLSRLVAAEDGFQVVAQYTSAPEALRLLPASNVDVVLVDLALAKEFMLGASKLHYTGKCLVVARTVDAMDSAAVLKCGASGIFLESDSSSRLFQAIRQVAGGETWVDQKVIRLLADRFPQYDASPLGHLTDRERTVLHAVVDGLSNRKIGDQLGVSESSVKATLQQLFMKAGVRTRSQLVRIALAGFPAQNASSAL
jgi:two-component system nitrate/nitrite response regulator NarL